MDVAEMRPGPPIATWAELRPSPSATPRVRPSVVSKGPPAWPAPLSDASTMERYSPEPPSPCEPVHAALGRMADAVRHPAGLVGSGWAGSGPGQAGERVRRPVRRP